MKHSSRILLTLLALAALPSLGRAQSLLSASYETQLEAWYGQGDLTFTQIFSKSVGDGKTGADFHASVEGIQGTFSLISISGRSPIMPGAQNVDRPLPLQVVGGFNSGIWSPAQGYSTDGTLNSFIFNLTSSEVMRQTNHFQTANWYTYGPTFGGGHDLHVSHDLDAGYSYAYSYGNQPFENDITFGGVGNYNSFNVLSVETYRVSQAETPNVVPVPEPSTYGLMGAGVLGCLGLLRKKRRKQA